MKNGILWLFLCDCFLSFVFLDGNFYCPLSSINRYTANVMCNKYRQQRFLIVAFTMSGKNKCNNRQHSYIYIYIYNKVNNVNVGDK